MNHAHLFVVVVSVRVQIGPHSYMHTNTHTFSLPPSSHPTPPRTIFLSLSLEKSQRKWTDMKPQQFVSFLSDGSLLSRLNSSSTWYSVYCDTEIVCLHLRHCIRSCKPSLVSCVPLNLETREKSFRVAEQMAARCVILSWFKPTHLELAVSYVVSVTLRPWSISLYWHLLNMLVV